MLDRQNFDVVGMNAIGHDVGRPDNDQLSRTATAAGPASTRCAGETLDAKCDGANDASGSGGIVGFYVSANAFEATTRSPRPSDRSLHRRR
jgi:hypothetical protein